MKTEQTTFVNEFIARGIVLEVGKSDYSGRVLRLLVRERRNELLLNISLEPGVGHNIGRKDRVLVKGYTKAFNYHNDALNKDSYVMYFTATEVKKDTTELSQRFGQHLGKFYPEPVFRAFVSGRVEKVVEPNENKWAQITVETCGGGRDLRASHIVLRYYAGGHLPFFDYREGDIICARLAAFTPEKKMNNGKSFRFQNLIVEDIDYLEKVPRGNEKELRASVDLGLPTEAPEDVNTNDADNGAADEFADDSALMEHSY